MSDPNKLLVGLLRIVKAVNTVEDSVKAINTKIASMVTIDDTAPSATTTYSSNKIESDIDTKVKTAVDTAIAAIPNDFIWSSSEW